MYQRGLCMPHTMLACRTLMLAFSAQAQVATNANVPPATATKQA